MTHSPAFNNFMSHKHGNKQVCLNCVQDILMSFGNASIVVFLYSQHIF